MRTGIKEFIPVRRISLGNAMSEQNITSFDLKDVRKILQNCPKESSPAVKGGQICVPKNEAMLKQEQEEAMEQPIIGYRVLDKMGSGGTAVVFKAQNIANNEIVALKLLYPGFVQDKKSLKQFVNEGMMLMRLDHPNILKGIDFGVSKGMYFIALEFVHGESLDLFLRQGFRFTEEYTFGVALQIAQALAYLESNSIVHRDIKPANILLMEESDVKLCDFAFAFESNKQDKDDGVFDVTCGTVEYISPEQARGYRDIDIRSDIYSLGITCIHMLTGHVPFSDKDPNEVMRCQIYEKINLNKIPISQHGRMILQRMVAKKREQRLLPSRLVPVLKKFLKNLNLKNTEVKK